MTWQEVKDFLDHIRTTCMEDRQRYKLEARKWRHVSDVLAEELRRWGWGDFHYGSRLSQEQSVVEALSVYDVAVNDTGADRG